MPVRKKKDDKSDSDEDFEMAQDRIGDEEEVEDGEDDVETRTRSSKKVSPQKKALGGATTRRSSQAAVEAEVIESSSDDDEAEGERRLRRQKQKQQDSTRKSTRASTNSASPKKKEATTPRDHKKEKKVMAISSDEDEEMNEVTSSKDGEEGEEGEYDDEEDNVYVIRKILKHRTAADGTIAYHIRWEGYGSEDDTWEPEGNCNAPDLVKKYWKGVPTHRQPRKMQEVQKKLAKFKSPQKKAGGGGRKGGDNEDDDDNVIEDDQNESDEVESTLKKQSSTKKRKPREEEIEEVEADELEGEGGSDAEEQDPAVKREKEMAESKEIRAKWLLELASWDADLDGVETVVRDDDLVLRAFVAGKNGDKFWAVREDLYERCPQAMLRFYEAHLRFRSSNN